MTGCTINSMEALVQNIKEGKFDGNKWAIKKVYINEDPAIEQNMPCPVCSPRNLFNVVRYLYLNCNEAIYKCEASNCMYPFRNFKYKNYGDNTVYQYKPLHSSEVCEDQFDSDNLKSIAKEYNVYEQSLEDVGAVDFDLNFHVFENLNKNHSPVKGIRVPVGDLKGESSSEVLDIRLIDDLLHELLPASTPPPESCNSKTYHDIHPEMDKPKNPSNNLTARKLEKCLIELHKTKTLREEQIFKVPTVVQDNEQPYKVENLSPTRLRLKKVLLGKGTHRSRKYDHNSPDDKSERKNNMHAVVKKKSLKPLEFLSTLNTLSSGSNHNVGKINATSNPRNITNPAKVQKMLNFIKRSMKNRDRSDIVFTGAKIE